MEFNPADRRRLSAGGQAGETIVAAGRRWAAAAVRAARVAQALHRAAADLVAGAPPVPPAAKRARPQQSHRPKFFLEVFSGCGRLTGAMLEVGPHSGPAIDIANGAESSAIGQCSASC